MARITFRVKLSAFYFKRKEVDSNSDNDNNREVSFLEILTLLSTLLI